MMLGRTKDALAPLEKAAELRKGSRLATAIAETNFALARALWDAGGDAGGDAGDNAQRARARPLAAAAKTAYSEAAQAYGSRYFREAATAIEAWEQARR
jgi:hypothetical protein